MRAALLAGFTLLELMVVLAIVGFLAALAGPSLTEASRSARERQDIVAIQAHLSEARLTARRLNRCAILERLNEHELRWSTFSDGSARCPDSSLEDQSRTLKLPATRWRLLDMEGVDDTEGKLLFLRSGGTPYADKASVRLQSVSSSQVRYLDIIPATGAMRERR